MWFRVDLKERAKGVLRKYYWIAFLVTLIAFIFGGTSSGGTPQFTYKFNSSDFHIDRWNWNGFEGAPDAVSGIAGLLFGSAIASIALLSILGGIVYAVFVCGPLETGMDRYFIDARRDKSDFVNLLFAFRGGRYMNIVRAMGWKLLFTFLWTLLLIIPGIVKGYAYSMIPYIMAENPNMNYRDAMILSMKMTDGQKGDMFILDLSFLGWYLLGILTCGIGMFFVNPYYYATKAELYAELKYRAASAGIYPGDGQGGYVTTV